MKEELEDTNEVIRIRNSKTNRQHNGQKKRDKRTNNDLQKTHKTKDRVTRPPLKQGVHTGRSNISSSTIGTRRVNLVTNSVISHEGGKHRKVFTTNGTYPWSFVTQIFHNGQPSHGGDRKTFEVMTSN